MAGTGVGNLLEKTGGIDAVKEGLGRYRPVTGDKYNRARDIWGKVK